MKVSTRASLMADLHALGVGPGDMLMVHAALRSIGPVLGGVNTVVHSLLDALGPTGTLLAYADWEAGVDDEQWTDPELRDQLPAFDKRIARAIRTHGFLPEAIRTWPGAVRSDHPDAGVVAIGHRAQWLCADHPFQYGYGSGSPFQKLIEAGGKVLMLGAPLTTMTLLHHSEHLAGIPGKRVVQYERPMLIDGCRQRVRFEEFDTTEPVVDALLGQDHFDEIGREYFASGRGSKGLTGRAECHLVDAGDMHRFAMAWLVRECGDP